MYAGGLSCISFLYSLIAFYAIIPQTQPRSVWADILSINGANAPVINSTSKMSLLNASSPEVSCFDNIPGFKPVNMANYFAAVQQILVREDAFVQRQFYLGPTHGVRWEWRGGARGDAHECVVVLFNKDPLLTDAFPIMLIAHVAALIADVCITERRSYAGGWASPGNNRGLVAVVNARSNGIQSNYRALGDI